MEDLGQPSSYLSLNKGLPVYASDGKQLGKVEHVMSVPNLDLFEGIILDKSVLPGGHRFVDALVVDEAYERGVVLKIDAAAAASLPEPSANPGEIEIGGADLVKGDHEKLHRAWNLISGKG